MSFFFFNGTATTEFYTYLHTLSLHDALPISAGNERGHQARSRRRIGILVGPDFEPLGACLFDRGDDVGRLAPDLRPQLLDMGDDPRNFCLARDGDHFVDRGDDADVVLSLVAVIAEDRKSTRLNSSHS